MTKSKISSDFRVFQDLFSCYQHMGIQIEKNAQISIHRIHEIHATYPFKSIRMRSNYFSVMLIRSGSGAYFLDSQRYSIKKNTIYFTNPGHIKAFELNEKPDAYLLTFSEAFLSECIHESTFKEFPFLLSESPPPHYLNDEAFSLYWDKIEAIYEENKRKAKYKNKILGNLVSALLYQIKEGFWNDFHFGDGITKDSQIVIQFKRNLEQIFRDYTTSVDKSPPKVGDFAKMQLLHPNYLSTVIKTKTGKSVNQWISQKVINEAKTFLSHGDTTVKEITHRLGFQETGQFSKYFKKHTGFTPSEFRKSFTF